MHKIGHGGTHLTSWAQELHAVALDGQVESLCFSPDNASLAAAVGEAICILSATLEVKKTWSNAHEGAPVRSLRWSPMALVSAGADAKLRLWDTAAELCTAQLEGHLGEVLAVAVAADGTVASGSADATVKLWSNAKEEGTFAGHEAAVHSVAFCRDATMLVSASADKTARIWSIDGRCLAVLQHKDEASSLVTGCMDGTVLIWHLDSGSLTALAPSHVCRSHHGGVTDLSIGENGQTLCTASVDKSVKLWTLHDGRFARSLPCSGAVRAVAISAAGAARVASATARGQVKVFGIVPRGREAGMFA